MPIVMPTSPSPGMPSSLLIEGGVTDSALVNIGGLIRRGGGAESEGRTIAGSMRLGRYVGMKPFEEIQRIKNEQLKAQLTQYVEDLIAQGYKKINANTLERDVGGGQKEVVTIDWNTGAQTSAYAQTAEAAKLERQALQQEKARERSSVNQALLESYTKPYTAAGQSASFGSREFFLNKAATAKSPSERQSFLDAADRATARAFNLTQPDKAIVGLITAYAVGDRANISEKDVTHAMKVLKQYNPGATDLDIMNYVTTTKTYKDAIAKSTTPSGESTYKTTSSGSGGGGSSSKTSTTSSTKTTTPASSYSYYGYKQYTDTSPGSITKSILAPSLSSPSKTSGSSSFTSGGGSASGGGGGATSTKSMSSTTGSTVANIVSKTPAASLGSALGSALNKAVNTIKSIISPKPKTDTKSKSYRMGYMGYSMPRYNFGGYSTTMNPVNKLLYSEVNRQPVNRMLYSTIGRRGPPNPVNKLLSPNPVNKLLSSEVKRWKRW